MGAFSCEDTGKKKSKKVKNGNKKILPGFENWNDRLPECVVLCEAVAAYGTDSLSVAKDYFDALRGLAQDNSAESYEEELAYMVAKGKEFFDVVNRMLARSAAARTSAAPEWYELKRKVCLLLAPHSFDHYMQYVEWNREPARKFWVPRRSVLMGLCNDLQSTRLNFSG